MYNNYWKMNNQITSNFPKEIVSEINEYIKGDYKYIHNKNLKNVIQHIGSRSWQEWYEFYEKELQSDNLEVDNWSYRNAEQHICWFLLFDKYANVYRPASLAYITDCMDDDMIEFDNYGNQIYSERESEVVFLDIHPRPENVTPKFLLQNFEFWKPLPNNKCPDELSKFHNNHWNWCDDFKEYIFREKN